MNEKPQSSWFMTKAGVLIMLFLVLGPFGLPLLYKSKDFSKTQKFWWTVAVLLYTAIAVILIVVLIMYIWRMMQQVLNMQ